MEVCLILDGGNQKSFLSERARDRFKLEPTSVQSLSVVTFSCNSGSRRVCPIVNVGMCIRSYPSMSLCLVVMPTICKPLARQPIFKCISQHSHLSGIKLANSSAKALNVLN